MQSGNQRIEVKLFMSWDDWVFGILTGGAYNVAKGAYEGGKAVGDAVGAAGDAVEDIGKAVSTISSKATTLMDDMADFIRELEEMVVIDRQVARTEDELWDEEVRRIRDIRAKEAALVAQVKTLGGNDDTASLQKYIYDGMISMVTGGGNAATKVLYQLALQILILRQAINDILYQEPGVIPETVYNVKEVIERFRTLEQPRIEALMDRSEDTIQETTEILVEVKKLFVVKKWVLKNTARLTAREQDDIKRLTLEKEAYSALIGKHLAISDQVSQKMFQQKPGPLPVGTVAMAAAGAGELRAASAAGGFRLDADTRLGGISSELALRGITSRFVRPQNLAYMNGYTAIHGNIRFYERERLKVEKKIFVLSWELVEEPGVIPRTLDEVHLTVQRFRTMEQPKIEKIMDVSADTIAEGKVVLVSVDATVRESKDLLSQVNASLSRIQGWFDFLAAYRAPLLIGCVVFGVLVIAIMVTVLIVLVKMALA